MQSPTAPATPAPVLGREPELARIAAFVAGPGGGTLVLTGEAGAGKTTLLRRGIEDARRAGTTVLVARPAECEEQLAFAGLADLFEGVGEAELGALPDPQRRGLEAALRRAEGGPAIDPLAVSQAVLGVLRGLAARGPVLVALDDAQWLDAPTGRVLEFAARRLEAEPVAILAAVRGGADVAAAAPVVRVVDPDRLARLAVGPLSVEAVGRLVGERLGRVPGRTIAGRIRELSGGNPFHALELGRAWIAAGAPADAGAVAVPESLAGLIRGRLAKLSPDARDATLTTAIALRPTRALVAAALGEAAAETGIGDAVAAGVLEARPDGRLEFSHPLLAWASGPDAAEARRRFAHERLAAVAPDPDERARHRAAVTDGTDEAVAADLDAAAGRANDRGAPETAAELRLEARRLTPPGDAAAIRRRTLAAAEMMIRAGNPTRARAELEALVAATAPGPDRVPVLALLADIRSGDDWEAKIVLLRQALDEAAPTGRDRAEVEIALGVASWAVVRELPEGLAHARRALACAEQTGDPSIIVRAMASIGFLEAFVGELDGALERLDRGTPLEPMAADVRLLFRPGIVRPIVLEAADRPAEAKARLLELLEEVERLGDSDTRPLVLINLGTADLRLGDWAAAARWTEEGEIASELLGHDSSRAMAAAQRARLEAHRGDVERARAAAALGIELATKSGSAWNELFSRVALALAELSVGDHAAALAAALPGAERLAAAGVGHSPTTPIVPLAAEAAALAGDHELAGPLLERLRAFGERHDNPSALRAWHRARALLAASSGDLEAALDAAAASVREAGRIEEPFEVARSRLVEAEVLRRLRRRAPARVAAAAALATFERLGARAWAERARSELARTGVPVGGGGRADLTPTQRQVAALVAAGRTNREVARELFMSPHTVEAHLTAIYRALGIRTRTDLARVLASGEAEPHD